MMYKRIYCITIVLILTAMFLSFGVKPTYASEVQSIPKADILLLYSKNISEDQVKDVASIADILTYFGYNVSYSNIENSIGQLNKFSNIIIYSVNEKENNDFINELCNSDSQVMIIGGKIIQQINDKMNLSINCQSIENYSYNITYKFSNKNEAKISDDTQNATLLKGKFDYTSGSLTARNINGFYCTRMGRITHIVSYNQKSDILKAIFTQEIALWMWPYKGLPHSYAQYIVFDEVYPFTDPSKLIKIADFMKNNNVPYAISVMPIYDNINFLSMKRFCEALTYIQANGGAVILHNPIIQGDKISTEDIQKKINVAFSAYTSYGVYPIAFEAPSNWMYNDIGKEIMKRFRTIVLYPSEESGWTTNEMNNEIYSDGHKIIAPALSMGNDSSNFVKFHSTAVYVDINDNIDELSGKIEAIKSSEISVNSMWSLGQAVYTDNKALLYENSILTLQGKIVKLEYVPFEYDEKSNLKKSSITNMTEIIAQNNKLLLLGIMVAITIFIALIFIARYRNRKKFFYNNEKTEK